MPALAAASAPAAAKEASVPASQKQMYEDIEILRRLLNRKLVSEYAPAKAVAESPETWWIPLADGTLRTNNLQPYDNRYELLGTGNPLAGYETSIGTLGLGMPSLRTGITGYPYNTSNPYGIANPYLGITVFQDQLNVNPSRGLRLGWTLHRGHDRILDTEGTYLKGQGVIYTLTLPRPQHDPRAGAGKPAAKPISDWDRIRSELRNEKPKPEEKEQPQKEPSLVDIILKVLAENGRHFAQLGDDESITVIVTLRSDDPVPARSAEADKEDAAALLAEGAQAVKEGEKTAREAGASSPTSAHDYELLGDLQLKQGKYDEAAKAYQQALELKPASKQAAALYRKLAQAYLGLGKDGDARQTIDKALEAAKAGQAEGTKPQQHGEAAGSPLPSKLIISVPRKLLDQVATGKISMEEFTKAANVDYLTFPATKE
jgi:tetratricopeptide (TPR) repeat protein